MIRSPSGPLTNKSGWRPSRITKSSYLLLGKDWNGKNRYVRLKGLHRTLHNNTIISFARLLLAQALLDLELQDGARCCLGFILGENQFNAMGVTGMGQDPLRPNHCIIGPVPGLLIASGIEHDLFTRYNETSGDKEVWVMPTVFAMSLAAQLAEPFHLSGKITGVDNPSGTQLTLASLDGDVPIDKIVVDRDGTFGPLALSAGIKYELRAGPVTRRITAIAGGTSNITIAPRGEVRLVRGTTLYTTAMPNTTVDGPPTEVLQPYAGQDVTLNVLLMPQGTPPASGRLLLSGHNVTLPETAIEYQVKDGKPGHVEIVFRPDTPGEVFIVRATLQNQPDAVLEWVGVAHQFNEQQILSSIAANNLFPNPSFENWNDSKTLPLSWEPWTPAERKHLWSYAPDTSVKKFSERSLKITASTNINLGKRVPITPGETYSISAWIKVDEKAALRLYLALLIEKRWKGEVLKTDKLKKDFTLTPGKWTYVTFTGTTPDHMPLCEAYFYFTTEKPNVFHIDGVMFNKGVATEYHGKTEKTQIEPLTNEKTE